MMEINPKLLIILISMSIVCAISIFGSFINWVNDEFGGSLSGDPNRWKWMTVVSMLLMLFLFFTPLSNG